MHSAAPLVESKLEKGVGDKPPRSEEAAERREALCALSPVETASGVRPHGDDVHVAVKTEEPGTAVPRMSPALPDERGLQLAPQSASDPPNVNALLGGGPATQVSRGEQPPTLAPAPKQEPREAGSAAHQARPDEATRQPAVVQPAPAAGGEKPPASASDASHAEPEAPPADPMDALLELSRAADVLSSLGIFGGGDPNPSAAVAGAPAGAPPASVALVGGGEPAPPARAHEGAAAVSTSAAAAASTAAAAASTAAVASTAAAAAAVIPASAAARAAAAPAATSAATKSAPVVRQRPPRAASQPERSPASKLEERVRRMKEGSIMTAIGAIKLGDHLDVKWLEGDGQFYTATVKALTDAGVTVVYPQTEEWDEWDEVLPLDEIAEARVKRAAAPPAKASPKPTVATTGLKRKHPGGSPRQGDGAGCSWTEREDAQLTQMVHDEGFGNWETKASNFLSARTPNALRQRWCSHLSHLQTSEDEAAEASMAAGEADQSGAAGWTSREDQQLRQMIAREGTGSWETKSHKFATDRSAAALRFRWYKLSRDSGQADKDNGGGERESVDASRWSAREDRQLQGMVEAEGSGNWRQKAELFDTDRSADALRFRWYVIQKEGEAASPKHGSGDTASAELPVVAWTREEDEELRALCVREGTGNWAQKSESFSTDRTANALRHRWANFINVGGAQDKRQRPPPIVVEDNHPAPTLNPQQVHTPSAWLPAEDAQLRALVRKEGPGSWQNKADRFNTGRSAGALRFRWYVLKEEDEAAAEEKASATSAAAEEYTGAAAAKKRAHELVSRQAAGNGDAKAARAANGDRFSSTGRKSEWSLAEDTQLHELVAQSGAGNWKAKSESFKKPKRSSGALRKRWAYLKDNGVIVDPARGDSLAIQVPEASINEEDQEWRTALEQGFTCLCLYSKSWYEVRIAEVKSDEDGVRSTRRNSESVKVHYVGWKNYYDEWVPRLSQRLWSQGSTPRWFKKYEAVAVVSEDELLRRSSPPWTSAEDAQLSELCQAAPDGWEEKAKQFATPRTADSLCLRWALLQSDALCADESEADEDDAEEDEDDEVYSTRDGVTSSLGSRKHSSKAKALPKCLDWTDEEDELLKTLVETSGPSDWQTKTKHFGNRRSEGALRRRWCLLRDEMAEVAAADDEVSDDGQPLAWTDADDGELRKLIDESGPSNWQEKSQRFSSSNRSADSLRYRWTYVLKHQAAAAADAEDDDDLSDDDMGRVAPRGGSIRERAAAAEDNAWRAGLAVGSTCACLSHTDMFAAKVIDTRPPARPDSLSIGMVKVHYQGWSSNYDEWLSRTSSRLDRPEAAGQSRAPKPAHQPAGTKKDSNKKKKKAETVASSTATNASGAWSALEDKQLRTMCAKDGPGDWDAKAARFTAGERTASSIRQRWAKLQAERSHRTSSLGSDRGGGGGGSGGGEASRWSEEEDTHLRKMVAKSQENWRLIASRFVTDRTVSALRRRWYHLQEIALASSEDEEGSEDEEEEDEEGEEGEEEGSSDESDDSESGEEPGSSSSWLPAEDAELCKLVAEGGTGDWKTKAEAFSTERSAGAIRFRWYHLRDSGAATAACPPSAKAPAASSAAAAAGWTSAEDSQLLKLVRQRGVGDWQAKAEAFNTDRSSSAIRHRWSCYLAAKAAAATTKTTATSAKAAAQSPSSLASHGVRGSATSQRAGGGGSSSAAARRGSPRSTRQSTSVGDATADDSGTAPVAANVEKKAKTDEELARELQRELNGVGVRKRGRDSEPAPYM